jgi:acetate kinase
VTADRVLVVNAGSSTLKLSVVEADGRSSGARTLETIAGGLAPRVLAEELDALGGVSAVGHRVVHGGESFREATRVDDGVLARLRSLTTLAPIHQPRSLAALDAVWAALPDVPHVACFDTAFHATLPPAASTYAIPRAWRDRWPLRRYGFHGLSHAYASRRTAKLLGLPIEGLMCVPPLDEDAGARGSLERPVRRHDRASPRSRASSWRPAPAASTRGCPLGQAEGGLSTAEVSDGLEHAPIRLVGLAGTADMRGVLTRAGSGDADATLALDVYVYRVRAGIAAMAAAMGGIDALAFTGGVGEHAPEIRRRAVDGLGFLGVAVDAARNDSAAGDTVIGLDGASVASVVVEAREDAEIARQVRALLGGAA